MVAVLMVAETSLEASSVIGNTSSVGYGVIMM